LGSAGDSGSRGGYWRQSNRPRLRVRCWMRCIPVYTPSSPCVCSVYPQLPPGVSFICRKFPASRPISRYFSKSSHSHDTSTVCFCTFASLAASRCRLSCQSALSSLTRPRAAGTSSPRPGHAPASSRCVSRLGARAEAAGGALACHRGASWMKPPQHRNHPPPAPTPGTRPRFVPSRASPGPSGHQFGLHPDVFGYGR
jgi:hypothetical protein